MMIFRCVDCKEKSRYAQSEVEVWVDIYLCEDGILEASLDKCWSEEDLEKDELVCFHCGGKVEIVLNE